MQRPYTDSAYLDTEALVHAVHAGIRALDKLIDENYYRHPLQEQQEMSYNYRNVGLGCCGYATMLMKLGYRYGSPEAIDFTDTIFALMFRAAVIASNDLAKQFGPFPKYKDCVWDSQIMRKHFRTEEIDVMRQHGLRNCSLLSIAPTGSISNLINESGGCEPEFAMKYTRKTEGLNGGEERYFDVYCRAAREYMAIHNTDVLPDYFVSAEDIHWLDRVKTQAAMQDHVDTAISSTINLPFTATVEDVKNIYLESWRHGIKGITIFRSGCNRAPILSTDSSPEPAATHQETVNQSNDGSLPRGYIIDASDQVIGKKRKLVTGCGTLHVTAFFDPITGDLMETYLSKGSTGGCNNFMIGLSRLISLAARSGCDIRSIVDQLDSSGVCPSYAVRKATKHDTSRGSCCPMAVGNALIEMWEEMQWELSEPESDNYANIFDAICDVNALHEPQYSCTSDACCPECGEPIVHEGGCDTCKSCGWSRCG